MALYVSLKANLLNLSIVTFFYLKKLKDFIAY